MKFRFSLTWSLVALLTLLVIASQGVSYWMTADLMRSTVSERELDKARTVGSVIDSFIAQHAARAVLTAKLLQSHEQLASSVARAASDGGAAAARVLDAVFLDAKVDTLEVTDTQERVIYRAHDQGRKGDRVRSWGIAEALAGSATLASSSGATGVSIRAIEPLRAHGKIIGTVSAGVRVDAKFMRSLAADVGAELALVGRSGPLAFSAPEAARQLDTGAMTEAFEKKIPIYRQDSGTHSTSVYLPALIIDDAFVIVVRIDGAPAHAMQQANARKSAEFAALLFVVSVALGIGLLGLILAPLRRLRARAEKTAVQVTGQPITVQREGEVASVVAVLDTLTDRLVARNQELSEAKAAIGAASEARIAAEAASQAKSQFLASMSHEIRTPLNGVLGMADLLAGTPLNEEQQKYCGTIRTSGRNLYNLLSDVLDLARIEAGKVQIERSDFELVALLQEIADAYQELASARGNVFVPDIDPALPARIVGDPVRLRQVLSNLLGNAVKFTEGGQITLRVRRLDPRPGDGRIWLRIRVSDTGVGIAPDVLPRLFQPFVQADSSTTREYGGTGLGLAISRQLVELMGGWISAESTPGLGSTFRFEVPFDAAAACEPLSARPMSKPMAVRVLVAEDNQVNQAVIRATLTQFGATVTVVDDGAAAVDALQRAQFDLVFMDCQMPVMDGYQATARIRAAESGGHRIPIIAVTANALAGDRERCLKAGMDDYLAKPTTRQGIAGMLERWTTGASQDSGANTAAPALKFTAPSVIDELIEQLTAPVVSDIIRVYLRTAPEHLDALKQGVELGDLHKVRGTLHSLKSSTRSLGGTELGDLAAEGERRARSGDNGAFALLQPITVAMDAFCRALSTHPCMASET